MSCIFTSNFTPIHIFFQEFANKKLIPGFSINGTLVKSIKIIPSLKISFFFNKKTTSLGGFLVQFQHLADWHLGCQNA